MATKLKLIEINLNAAREIERILEKYEVNSCRCDGEPQHLNSCPSKEANQLMRPIVAPNNALKALTSFAGTAFRGPLA